MNDTMDKSCNQNDSAQEPNKPNILQAYAASYATRFATTGVPDGVPQRVLDLHNAELQAKQAVIDAIGKQLVAQSTGGERQSDKRAEPTIARYPAIEARVKIGGIKVVLLDGQPIAVKQNGYKLFELLLETPGEYVSLASHNLRTRDVESLPKELQDAVESDPGAGTRIKREYLA